MTQLGLKQIRTDGGTQPRAELDQLTIDDYADSMGNGDVFPPVTVFYDGVDYWLADGFHRLEAHRQLGLVHIDTDVRQGTRRDAVLYSVSVNAQHGKRRTNADKRRAVMALLQDDEWGKWSDREIARQCRVSQPLVSSIRKDISSDNHYHLTRTHTRNGKEVTSRHQPQVGVVSAARELIKDTPLADNPQAIKELSQLPSEAQIKIATVAAHHGVEHAETIPFMYHHMQRNSETWEEIEKSGVVQPGDEHEAVHISDHPLKLASATRLKSEIHSNLAMQANPQTGSFYDMGHYDYDKMDRKNGKNGGLASHQLINVSENNEWYTPPQYIASVHAVLGGIDVDPASNEMANEVIKAATIYTIDDPGIGHDWHGRVFLNPPYGRDNGESNQDQWSRELIRQYQDGIVTEAILLVNAVPGNKWFSRLWEFPICFVDHRIRFYNDETEAGQPTHSNVFVYMGPRIETFADEFSRHGVVAIGYRSATWDILTTV